MLVGLSNPSKRELAERFRIAKPRALRKYLAELKPAQAEAELNSYITSGKIGERFHKQISGQLVREVYKLSAHHGLKVAGGTTPQQLEVYRLVNNHAKFDIKRQRLGMSQSLAANVKFRHNVYGALGKARGTIFLLEFGRAWKRVQKLVDG